MNRPDSHTQDSSMDDLLDTLISEVRAEEPDSGAVEQAGRRVWARIAAEATSPAPMESIVNCAGFQELFADYKAGTLNPARRMLVEDHLHECVTCRKLLHATASQPKVMVMPKRSASSSPARWAVAATLLIGVGFGSWYTWNNFGPAPSGSRARVLASEGAVYRLEGNSLMPVSTGADLNERDVMRTAAGGHVSLRLIDGSTIEVGERAEFHVSATRRDTTLHLDRGQLIVQAAKRRTGHLYVTSPDSRVAVTGTVFSVNRGIAGSRVSVVEGEVHVEHGAEKNVLRAGDQVSTHPSMSKTSVLDDIAWSRNYDQYLVLLKQFVAIKGKLSQVHMPGLRYGSRLIGSVPE
ncbi:MAG: FecR domain-containing protein, partial [Bryobacteraceae bacterium]|nr:FecR domain-containing protein [Bryobacteraceae bacterium]